MTGSQYELEGQDVDVSASAPLVVAIAPSTSNTSIQIILWDSPCNTRNTQSLKGVTAASPTSPARKQRRVMESGAPSDICQHKSGANSATVAWVPTPRRLVDTGVRGDVEVELVADIIRKLLSNQKRLKPRKPSNKEVNTEELAAELLEWMRTTAPYTAEEPRQYQQERGLEACNATCGIAEDRYDAVPALPASPPVSRPSDALTSNSMSSATIMAAIPLPPVVVRHTEAAPSGSLADGNSGNTGQADNRLYGDGVHSAQATIKSE